MDEQPLQPAGKNYFSCYAFRLHLILATCLNACICTYSPPAPCNCTSCCHLLTIVNSSKKAISGSLPRRSETGSYEHANQVLRPRLCCLANTNIGGFRSQTTPLETTPYEHLEVPFSPMSMPVFCNSDYSSYSEWFLLAEVHLFACVLLLQSPLHTHRVALTLGWYFAGNPSASLKCPCSAP